MKGPVPALGGTTPTEALSSFVVPHATWTIPVKTGIQAALPKTALPNQGACGRYQPVIAAKAAIQRASIGDRPSLYAGCMLDTTLPADATGLDSGLRRNDMGRGPLSGWCGSVIGAPLFRP